MLPVITLFIYCSIGYWFLHDERPSYWSQGLGVILHVGAEDDVPPVPDQFPACGNWVGPEFFLI